MQGQIRQLGTIYDFNGRFISWGNRLETIASYIYGNLTKVIDALGNETVYTYDGKYIIKKVDAQGRATRVTYNKV
ncbi:MAG: RHS repeat protein [Desulfobacula sp.]|uniref:RHS repeat domain-containing protein n=1 Tax=Desulfobacula sp. TaxID=2593537 RepID=UPI0025BCFFBA|nr:RHS repeat domain-containing protein [Desulfobacula sp.]MCD4719198.1 RHS repeat protein [Desulfobacula sp.]